MTAGGDGASARLERAVELFLQFDQCGGDAAELLAANPELRELLEPMLAASQGDTVFAGAAAAPAAPAADADADGEAVLGDFRLLRELGRGGMGIVYEAWQRSLDRRVALKVLAPALVADAAAVARFRREAAAVARLHHPGIVEVFGFGCDRDRHWFAMELVDGEPLSSCRRRFAAPGAAVALVAQVVDALQHAHAAGLVHRDVKPGNVLVRGDGSAVLTDFGLASDSELPTVTTTGSFLGTLDYASPEQVQGDKVDARSDVWSVGAVLYELLAGARPFARGTPAATMRAILAEEPAGLRTANPAVGADLAAVVGRALTKDRQRRYPSAVALLADLRALQGGGSVTARAPSPSERLRRWAAREPWRAVALAVVLLAVPVLTAVLGYLLANQPRIAAAAAAERQALREEALGQAWFCFGEQQWEEGLAALPAPADAAADVEIAASRATALAELDRRDEALAALAAAPAVPLIAAVRSWVDKRGGVADLEALAGDDAFACFVAGAMYYDRAQTAPQPDELYRRAVQRLACAVALSPTPRLTYLAHWLRAAANVDDAGAMLAADRAMLVHFPGSRAASAARAAALVEAQPERAIAAIGELQAQSSSLAPMHMFNLGVANEKLGRFDQAKQRYRECVARYRRHAKAWNNLGMMLRRDDDQAGAAAAFRAAIAAQPRHAKAWNNLGTALRALGDTDGARQALERAIELVPDYAIAHFNLGNLQYAGKQLEPAMASFRRAIAANPRYARAHANLGNALYDSGQKQQALLVYARAAELAPNDLVPQHNLANTALRLQLLDLALPAAERAVEVGKRSPDAWCILAEVLLARQPVDAARALQAAQQAAQLQKGSKPHIRLVLARAQAAAGEVAAARQLLLALQQEEAVQQDADLLQEVATALAALPPGR